ncbi:hypothetical protein SAMN04488118_10987 [Epibacterium ulvae]|uniref:Uncharacterized protein n=2 Tax=Epibacterium ulvae TaxID=1156985 RepID=A0A1G5R651_9RHOB|nr:hypothetical protein SAMN04488118_10987 [Epibacterium ulvae]
MEGGQMIWPFRHTEPPKQPPIFNFEITCDNCDARHAVTDPDLDAQIQRACTQMDQKMNDLTRDFGIGNGLGTWGYDDDVGMLEFRFPDGGIVETPLSYIGSWFEPRQELLWAWANPHLDPARTEVASHCYDYGDANNHQVLMSQPVWCSLDDAWHLAKLAGTLAEVEGVYSAPIDENLRFFWAIRDPKWRVLQ